MRQRREPRHDQPPPASTAPPRLHRGDQRHQQRRIQRSGGVAYTNATGKLKILPMGGTLHWYHVHGCAGLVGNGDPTQLSATYATSPPQTITSP